MLELQLLFGGKTSTLSPQGLTPAPSRSLLSHQPQVLQSGCVLGSLVLLSLLWQRVVTGAALESHRQLYMSSRRADCNRASLTRVHRQTYARLYPVLLVKQDGSTIHIRYREPRRMLTVSFLPRHSPGVQVSEDLACRNCSSRGSWGQNPPSLDWGGRASHGSELFEEREEGDLELTPHTKMRKQ
uniref:39S ribosomal protein L55, mitochondrial n=1 Tax=Balaenoptera musculus TaxID=9771 RepID=A0A8C0CXW5_BALMU